MSTVHELLQSGERLLAKAVFYRFLAAGYRYPTEAAFRALNELAAGLDTALSTLVSIGMITSDLPDSLADDAVLEELRNTSRVLLEDVHVALFGHAVQGQCPPYEAEYGTSPDSLLRPHLLADLSAFYRAFDLEVEDRLGERSDFVGLECEFVAFLCMKQDYAASHNEHELVRQVESAHRKFLSDHLGHWVPAFAARLSSKYPKGFLASLTHLLVAMVKLDARDMGVPVGDEDLDLRLDYEPLPSCGQCPHATEEETTS